MAEEPETTPALVPVREEHVAFYGDDILAAQLANGTIMVPIRPIVERLGLDWPAQAQRLKRDRRLRAAQGVVMITTPGGVQPMTALPLKLLPGWLSKIDAARVRDELRARIERYQDECYEVLWEYFKGQILPTAPAPPPAGPATGAEQALALAEAMVEIARQQVELERRHNLMADYMRDFVKTTKSRLNALELELAGEPKISEAQVAEIGLAVKRVAIARAAHDGANHYGEVYDELYRRFAVGSYKNIPRSQYPSVLAWLREQFDEASGTSDGPGESRV